jgi:hypothetical protein
MNLSDSRSFGWARKIRVRPGLAFAIIILIALGAFEMFNYSTTEFALNDLLGNLKFFNIPWATILSIAFCGIDFAGIARLFTPEQGSEEPKEVWYLFGAWLLAATMNAILTWWGVSMAIVNHTVHSSTIMDNATLTRIVPVFVAVMVWVIRILIIGTLSVAGERLFTGQQARAYNGRGRSVGVPASPSTTTMNTASTFSPRPSLARPSINRQPIVPEPLSARPEPTYHSVTAAPRSPLHGSIGDSSSNESRKM